MTRLRRLVCPFVILILAGGAALSSAQVDSEMSVDEFLSILESRERILRTVDGVFSIELSEGAGWQDYRIAAAKTQQADYKFYQVPTPVEIPERAEIAAPQTHYFRMRWNATGSKRVDLLENWGGDLSSAKTTSSYCFNKQVWQRVFARPPAGLSVVIDSTETVHGGL